ncbi:glutamate--tRNA ligase, partial [Ruminococcaceae bacterium OttesenSCG-928-O06]|nr:glutamate--tRNA ligase [Ruminococcaceae bacterium OttesenSCG-928-O06]
LTGDNGAYGPYRQRQRAGIYHICARYLVQAGLAYPCFLTEEELAEIRAQQQAEKLNFGCYGRFAKYRDASFAQYTALLESGKPWVVRLRSGGNAQNRIKVDDVVRGVLEMPENDQDVVLLKADGIPTYHFAHVVDDHFMRTTLVVRGEEWLATLPIHVQLFAAMGWKPPRYLHTAHLMKQDGAGKRKLSKRKDPELALDFYGEQGYPVAAVKEYLMTLLNSNFEDWRAQNPEKPLEAFPFSVKKMGVSGALFDMDKLDDVSKGVISRLTAQQVYEELLAWAQQHDAEFAALLARDEGFSLAMLAIGRGGKKPRKDITRWGDARAYFSFYFEELFCPDYTLPDTVPAATAQKMLAAWKDAYDPADDSAAWFDKVKALARAFGYADDMKAWRQAPENWPGSVADVSMVLRLATTGRKESPDLAEVMRVLGPQEVCRRMDRMAAALA